MQGDATCCAICKPKNVQHRQERELQKFYQRSYAVDLSDLYNATKKYWTKFRVIGTLTNICTNVRVN